MRRLVRAYLIAALAIAAVSIFPTSAGAQEVPQKLQPPANEQLIMQLHGKGDQIYTCKADGGQFGWTLKAPEAQLFDKSGKLYGKHFAGPSWEVRAAYLADYLFFAPK